MLPFESSLTGKKILVTGHTGFTGSWACMWLKSFGAQLFGYALPPETNPALYSLLDLDVETLLNDIRFDSIFFDAVNRFQPDLIMHLAAQPLVRRGYREPVLTFAVNAQGTAHVLEAARQVNSVKGVLCITTDKVYQNNEWVWAYRENDPLGGKDPYSGSKSAAEMVIQSFAASYKELRIAVARGGNIIGGGDFSEDRLVPDFVRAVVHHTPLVIRNPHAVRPWQHVLALVHGYMLLLAGLVSDEPEKFARAWNFGSDPESRFSVNDVLEIMSGQWKKPKIEYLESDLKEAHTLALDSSLARTTLGWKPFWNTEQSIIETIKWYRAHAENPSRIKEFTTAQLNAWRQGIVQ